MSCVENYYQMKWTGVYSDGKFCLVDAMCITHLENMPITMVTLPDKKVDRKQYDSADRSRMLSQTSSEFGEKSLSVHDCHS